MSKNTEPKTFKVGDDIVYKGDPYTVSALDLGQGLIYIFDTRRYIVSAVAADLLAELASIEEKG